MTLIQRFGSDLNLNVHFHMLFLDGVYEVDSEGNTVLFHAMKSPINRMGQKVLTLKTLPSRDEFDESVGESLAQSGGFSLHAGVSAKSHQRDKIERLC